MRCLKTNLATLFADKKAKMVFWYSGNGFALKERNGLNRGPYTILRDKTYRKEERTGVTKC